MLGFFGNVMKTDLAISDGISQVSYILLKSLCKVSIPMPSNVLIISMLIVELWNNFLFFCFNCHIYPPFTRKRIVSLYFGRYVRLAWELLFPRCLGHLSSI